MCHGYIISLLIHSLQMFKKYDKVYTCNIKKSMINNENSNKMIIKNTRLYTL